LRPVAKIEPGSAARRRSIETLFGMLSRTEIEVEAHLLIQVAIEFRAAREETQLAPKLGHLEHAAQPTSMTRKMA
jgi:hypothetical protein